MSGIRFDNQDGIVVLTLDSTGQSANTMNAEFRQDFHDVVAKLKETADLKGVIITSAKKTFFAGGDLDELIQATPEHSEMFFNMIEGMKADMRYLETMGKPVVVIINGAALGGGWELALLANHRIALNDPKTKMGLPEVQLGLLPGGGGVVRMVRLLGLQNALPYLAEGKQFGVDKGKEMGLLHDTADTPEQALQMAKDWIAANPKVQQPYDVKGYKIPGGSPRDPAMAQMLPIAPSMLRDKTKGCYPAPEFIMKAAVEGAMVDMDTALRIESRYFTKLATGPVAKNMINSYWFGLNKIKAGMSRPDGFEKTEFKKVGILGAGMMGSGIAYVCATRGIDVVLKDISIESAEKGKSYSQNLLDKRVSRGRSTPEKRDEILGRILATDKASDLQGCDLIIEAVFEKRELKAQVTKESEPFLADNGIMASNTSTLPITGLSEASRDATKFIGLHFFSPVDKMPLVEIIRGKQTSDETLAKAFDFVLQIAKTPIVVNDSRGFFTSRVFGKYIDEGMRLLAEGVHPARIEMAALKAGMPVGPLAVVDEVSLSLAEGVAAQTRADLEAEGIEMPESAIEQVVKAMIYDHQRKGKAAGAGFYEYPTDGGKKMLWKGLSQWYNADVDKQISEQDIIDRILMTQALDTVRCMDENVLMSEVDANIGSVFGIGFAPWTGGAIQYLKYLGKDTAIEKAEKLKARFGERFEVPAGLKNLA